MTPNIRNNFTVPVVDTDSITICKPDKSPFSEEEIKRLDKEVNEMFGEGIKWELEFKNLPKLIVLKTKNYILWDGNKIKQKGSSLKSSTKETALKELIQEVIESIIHEKTDFSEIYHRYINRARCISNKEEMKKWSSKKTITDKVLNSSRTNERKIFDALGDGEFHEGDKIWVYFKKDASLSLVENFDSDYDEWKLIEKVYNTMKLFQAVIDIKQFPRYYLKTKRKMLD
jgi:hypothetical protein